MRNNYSNQYESWTAYFEHIGGCGRKKLRVGNCVKYEGQIRGFSSTNEINKFYHRYTYWTGD